MLLIALVCVTNFQSDCISPLPEYDYRDIDMYFAHKFSVNHHWSAKVAAKSGKILEFYEFHCQRIIVFKNSVKGLLAI